MRSSLYFEIKGNSVLLWINDIAVTVSNIKQKTIASVIQSASPLASLPLHFFFFFCIHSLFDSEIKTYWKANLRVKRSISKSYVSFVFIYNRGHKPRRSLNGSHPLPLFNDVSSTKQTTVTMKHHWVSTELVSEVFQRLLIRIVACLKMVAKPFPSSSLCHSNVSRPTLLVSLIMN